MTTKHTPGRVLNRGKIGYAVDWNGFVSAMPDKQTATACAAAPDMLEACKKWIAQYDAYVRDSQIGDEPGIPEMRAAIAKAEGR